MQPYKRAFVVVAAVALSACTGSLLDSDMPVTTSYVLAPAPAAGSAASAAPVDLAIGLPGMAPGLNSQRIAVLKGQQLDYFRGARWGASAGEIVQTLLVDSLEDQHLFRSVTPEQTRIASDYVLDIDVRDFQAEYAGGGDAPAAHVRVVGRLIRVVDRQLVGTLVTSALKQASDNRMAAVMAAFESAAQQVALDLARKTAAAISADEPKLRSARGTP